MMATTIEISKVMEERQMRDAMRYVMDKVKESPVLSQLYQTARTMEDFYQVFKDICKLKWEEFKAVCTEFNNWIIPWRRHSVCNQRRIVVNR